MTFSATSPGLDSHGAKAAYLCHEASEDPYMSAESAVEMEQALGAAGRQTTFSTYPGTRHWFFDANRVEASDASAAALAWERTVALPPRRMAPASSGRFRGRDGTHVGSGAHAVAFLPRPRTRSDDPAQPTPGRSRIIATWISVSLVCTFRSSSFLMLLLRVIQLHGRSTTRAARHPRLEPGA